MEAEILPPPPPEIPLNVVPIRIEQANISSSLDSVNVKPLVGPVITPKPSSVITPKPGSLITPNPGSLITPKPGSNGKRVPLLSNHFKVTISSAISDFYHYDVLVCYEDGLEVTKKSTKMAVIEKLYETYKSELDSVDAKTFVYDGYQSLFAPGRLPQNNLEFPVVLNPVSAKGNDENDHKRQRIESRSNIFKVQMKFVSKIAMKSLSETKSGQRLTDCSGLRVLNMILQQRALKRGCLVIRQSVFSNDPSSFLDLGGGVLACRGLFSSFKALQGGLYLNHDVSMTTIIEPGPVIDFLVKNQNVKNPSKINWKEASRTLKNLRMKTNHLRKDFKIIGLSEKSCKEQKFALKVRGGASDLTIETTVYDYFVKTRGIELKYSADLPCINAGRPNKPTFFPIEICSLIPLQRYRKELTVYQKSAMLTKLRIKPDDVIKVLDNGVKTIVREDEPLLRSCGISINGSFAQVDGRVLTAPRLRMGNGEHIIPRNGGWNIKDKKFVEPQRLDNWAIVNFSTGCNVRQMCEDLAKISSAKGMVINPPVCVIEENPKNKKKPPSLRVDMMFGQISSKFRKKPPRFILCLLADKKFTDLYGPWKRKTIIEFGIVDQCIANSKIDEHYLLNILLKINGKLGGFNHTINSEFTRSIPMVSKIPTMILGMEVSHGRTNGPSIASVVGSRGWPRISSYKASLRAMPPRTHMIDSLFNPVSQHNDAGIIRELLLEFYSSSGHAKPAQLVIFRNGVSTTQFADIMNIEMDQVLKACNFLEENWRPKITVIVSQRRHHTKFFDATSGVNVTPGNIVDSKVCDLECSNFYMCPHAARMGTLRPTHYHVLLNEIGFSLDDLQELIHSLSYVFQRSNSAISEVAPVRYARLAAAKISQLIEQCKKMNTGFQLPKVHKNVSSTMFFI
ncbi:hypothetical protein CASFOL_013103 [Castilleja foliolosa]|uniref:Argonaute 4 n=1 Tax=Castilleja foliolosa TaxID=1961234 RepID=A0ABD3DJJ3_9LAMI